VRHIRRKKRDRKSKSKKMRIKEIKEDKWMPGQVQQQRVNTEYTPRLSVSLLQSEVPFRKRRQVIYEVSLK